MHPVGPRFASRRGMTATMRAIGGDSPARAWARALALTAQVGQHPDTTLPTLLGELAQSFGDKTALIGEKETLNYHSLTILGGPPRTGRVTVPALTRQAER